MPINSSKTLDPRSFIIISPLPISPPKGQKLQARSDTVYSAWEPCREHVFRENYHRRQKQLSQQGYWTASGRLYQEIGEPLYLDPKKLILHSLGQQDQICKDERNIRTEDIQEDNTSEAALGSGTKRKVSSEKWFHLKNRENELKILKRHLSHTRQLVSAVKQGQGYFQMLQREECDLRNAQQEEQRSFSESQRTECQPPKSSSDEEVTESFFRTEIPAQRRGLYRKSSKKITAVRPFTPVHSSLTCPRVTEPSVETVFRQLCSLNWLLEALTAEPAGGTGPVSSCWSLKDPGGSKMTVKRLNKEKAIETKWDHFITQPKPRKSASRILRKVSGRSRNTLLSSSRLSVMSSTLTPTMGSMSSLTPGSEDLPMGASGGAVGGVCESQDSQSAANISAQQQDQEEEAPLCDYLQKLLESVHQAVDKELHHTDQEKKHPNQSSLESNYISGRGSRDKQVGTDTKPQRPKSSPANRCSETSQFIASKSSLSSEMRDKFNETAEEAVMCLQDTLENTAKKRWENSTRKFQSLEYMTDFHQDISLLRAVANKSDSRDENSQKSTTWFSELLSRIPKAMLESHNVQSILGKLSRLCHKQSLRVRSSHFLKVLSGIRTWELCSPDLSVAIEIVREHIVQMSKEDYEAWLLPRVGLPQRVRSAPAVR
ncbi:coiled-coil domain-containing protein 60-like isoform X2 [Acipenser oxyrinchus oxyrinchus]|uniref:Coiled-coil domain-containing protein 60-like isoform X2 n=1 Tax=Acipenser oxyrinchus oxyrinchus TaxID=40147 RepID=A0AAD8D2M5_ACIOX|nr:coiled-coil domain-containing protein 60-like isoform X2 [Acipenser oxyrinchus oxyrinchus]